MYVGDSLRDDVEGASKVGLRAILLDRQGQHEGTGVEAIRTLEELFPLVKRLEQ